MSGRGSRGALPGVLKSLGLGGAPEKTRSSEEASCRICRSPLRFHTDAIGRMIEKCSNRGCVGRHPHSPLPDAPLLAPHVPKKRRKPPKDPTAHRS